MGTIKRHSLILVFFVLILNQIFAQHTPDKVKSEALRLSLKRGVVRITTFKGTDAKSIGAGVFLCEIGSEYYYLTAYHVVRRSTKILIDCYDNKETFVEAQIFKNKWDEQTDLCILTVPKNKMYGATQEPIYEINPQDIVLNQQVYALGHPPDKEWDLTKSSILKINQGKFILEKGVIQQSHSGGPLLNRYGNMIGIILGNDELGYGEVLKIDKAMSILQRWDVPCTPKITTEYCEICKNITTWANNDFNDIKGLPFEIAGQQSWEINDKYNDITGLGHSILFWFKVHGGRYEGYTVYSAYYGKHEYKEAISLKNNLSQKIVDCLPELKRDYPRGKSCRQSSWSLKFFDNTTIFVIYHSIETNGVYFLAYQGDYKLADILCNDEYDQYYDMIIDYCIHNYWDNY